MGKIINILAIMKLVENKYDKGKIPDSKFSQYTTTCGLWIEQSEKFPFGTMTFSTEL